MEHKKTSDAQRNIVVKPGYTYAPQRTNEYEGKSMYNMQGYARMFNRESQTWTLENIVTYNKDFGLHHFDLTSLYAAKSKLHPYKRRYPELHFTEIADQ